MTTRIGVWLTSEDGERYRLERQEDVVASPVEGEVAPRRGETVIRVNPAVTYQEILGIGSSLEEASVYHLWRMTPENRHRVLKDLVDPVEGMGWNLFRIAFGTSDFTSQPYYSYDDMPPGQTDPDLAHFSIQKDIDLHILDTLREVLEINPKVLFFASPWSPPGWMKSSGSMCAGHLLPEYYAVAARYYRMAVQSYVAQGIPIHAFTLQNEPLMVHKGYPTSYFGWKEQNAFLKHVRAEFDAHGLDTEIWIFDHNFKDAMTFPGRILADAESYPMVDGVAFHSYEGKPEAMSALHDAYPDVPFYFTERSTWGTKGMDEILRYFRHWARSYSAWVTCLDDRQQPNPGPHSCSPTFVTVSRDDPNEIRYIPETHLLGQISRFVQRGARRIESDYGSTRTLTGAAFANPDGSHVVIMVNGTRREQRLTLVYPGLRADTTIPARTVATCVW